MWTRARWLPWLLALVGLAIPMIGSGFIGWPVVAGWLVALATVWFVARQSQARHRAERITLAVILLPVLFLLGWEGGWWLIPADVSWLVIEAADRGPLHEGGRSD
jgi:MFS family permease